MRTKLILLTPIEMSVPVTVNGLHVVQASTNLVQANVCGAISTNTDPFAFADQSQFPRRLDRLAKP